MDPCYMTFEIKARGHEELIRYLAEFQAREMLGIPQPQYVPDLLKPFVAPENREPPKKN
jgi:hypothetical protein